MLKEETKWCVELAKDTSKWNEDVKFECPPVISKEYMRLKELLLECDVYGAYYQIKDLVEVIIKLPTLITLAAISEEDRGEYREALFIKPPALSDWINSLSRSQKFWREPNQRDFNELIKKTMDYINKTGILDWRNKIAHGAQGYSEDEMYILEITKRVEELNKFFDEIIKYYKPIAFIEKDPRIFVAFYDRLYNMYPFIQKNDGDIYFYNSIDQKNDTYKMLCYSTGKNWRSELLEAEPGNYMFASNDSAFSFNTEEKDKIIHSMVITERVYEKPLYIFEEVSTLINNRKTAFILLKMERAAGKTSFCLAMDQYRSDNVLNIQNTFARCFYISDHTSMTKQEFLDEINFILNTNEMNSSKYRNTGKFNKSKVSILVDFQKENIKRALKLLLIIDGIDEVTEKNIGIIEGIQELKQGESIYIIATSRSEKEEIGELGKYALSKSKDISTDILDYFHDERNERLVGKYIRKYSEDEEAERIIKYCGSSFLNAQLIYKIKNKYNLKFNEELKTEKLLEKYLELLTKKEYGEDSSFKLILLLQLLATSYEPLLLEEIQIFMKDTDDIMLLKYMQDISILLKIDRCSGGNIYSFSNKIYNDIISQKVGKNEVFIKAKLEIVKQIEDLILNSEITPFCSMPLSYYAQFYYSYTVDFSNAFKNNNYSVGYQLSVLRKIVELFFSNSEKSDFLKNDYNSSGFDINLNNYRKFAFAFKLINEKEIIESKDIDNYNKIKLIILSNPFKKSKNPKITKTSFNQTDNEEDYVWYDDVDDQWEDYETSNEGSAYDLEDYEEPIEEDDGGYIVGQNDYSDEQYFEEKVRSIYYREGDDYTAEIDQEYSCEWPDQWNCILSQECCIKLWDYINKNEIKDSLTLEWILNYGFSDFDKKFLLDEDFQDDEELETYDDDMENTDGNSGITNQSGELIIAEDEIPI